MSRDFIHHSLNHLSRSLCVVVALENLQMLVRPRKHLIQPLRISFVYQNIIVSR